MIAERRLVGLLLFGLFILMGYERSTFGQPDFFPDQTEMEEDEVAPVVQNAQFRARNLVVNEKVIYQRQIAGWLSLRQAQESRLRLQINQTCKAYQLSAWHKRKLKIAGLADILTFQQDARTLQMEMFFRLNPNKAGLGEFQDEFRRLSFAESNYPFRSDQCLYVKVLNRILKTEGITPRAIVYLDDEAAMNALDEVEYYSSLVETLVGALPPAMALRDKKQRIQLAEMLRQELQTKPRIDAEDAKLVWQTLSQISPERWNSILDGKQWTALKMKLGK